MKAPLTPKPVNNAAGFSVIELLIVAAMVVVISGFALIQIVRARQVMIRANAVQEFVGYLEKARLDSVRRRPVGTAEMAQVTIVNATFYSVTIDADGNGTLDAPKVIRLPVNTDLQFNGTFPRTIYFNWRGRTVNAANAITAPSTISITSVINGYGSTLINVSDNGQYVIGGSITSNPVNNTNPAPAPTFRDNTKLTP